MTEPIADRDREHIVCACRPKLGFCGTVAHGPINDLDVDGSECAGCLEVWLLKGTCPYCGCRMDEWCDQCAEVD